MIVYQLACPQDHFFEGWFASAEACQQQADGGRLQCPTCESAEIRKLPAAPYVKGAASDAPAAVPPELRAQVLAALRKHIAENTEDVGTQFAEVARRIHYREEDARNIRGRVTLQEAAELREEGVETIALPPELVPPDTAH